MLCAHVLPYRSCTTVNALVTLVSALRAGLTDGAGSAVSLLFFSGLQVSVRTYGTRTWWSQRIAWVGSHAGQYASTVKTLSKINLFPRFTQPQPSWC